MFLQGLKGSRERVCKRFLGLLEQITANTLLQNNQNLFSHGLKQLQLVTLPPEALGKNPSLLPPSFWLLPAVLGHSLACSCLVPILHLFSPGHLPSVCVCLCLNFPLSVRAHPNSLWCHLHLVTVAQILFPSKVTQVLGVRT